MQEALGLVGEAVVWGGDHYSSMKEARKKAENVIEAIHEAVKRQNGYPPDYLEDRFRVALFDLGFFLGRTYQDVPEVFKDG